MPRKSGEQYGSWKYGHRRSGVYWIDRTIAGRRIRISTGCSTLAAANAEYARFELNPAAYVNRAGRKALARRPDPARAEQLRVNHLARTYQIDAAEYDRRLREQGGGCAICGSAPTDTKRGGLEVDHDHATGAVRGLLCGPCNRGIGNLGESADLLRRAAAYLEERGPGVGPAAIPEKRAGDPE